MYDHCPLSSPSNGRSTSRSSESLVSKSGRSCGTGGGSIIEGRVIEGRVIGGVGRIEAALDDVPSTPSLALDVDCVVVVVVVDVADENHIIF
jgi:hypothetical protein